MSETKLLPPFAGVRVRPYSQDRLKDVDWYKLKARYIPVSELWLTQTHLNIEGILGKAFSRDPFPRAVRAFGDLYIEDGHHRIVLAVYNGARSIHIRVHDLPML